MELSVPDIEGDMPIAEGTIRSIENGEIETPSMPVIEAFAKVLKVSKKDLLSKLPESAEPADEVAKNKADTSEIVADENGVEDAQGGSIQVPETGSEVHNISSEEVAVDAEQENQAADTPLAEAVKGDFAEVQQHMPLGGATSISGAEEFISAQDKKMAAISNWHLLQEVMDNIRRRGEFDPNFDQAAAMAQAISETGDRIAALKSSIEDAYLLYEVTPSVEPADVIETTQVTRGEIMTDPTQPIVQAGESAVLHPADAMKANVDQILGNPALNRDGKAQAIQTELEQYAGIVKAQLDQVAPPDQTALMADALKGALAEVMGPLNENIGLLTAKMGQQPQPATPVHQVASIPVQKSAVPGQNIAPVGAGSGTLPISPVTGQPSALTAAIRKSVGIQ